MSTTITTTLAALALGTAIAIAPTAPAAAAEFTSFDLYNVCAAGLDDMTGQHFSSFRACFGFLGQIWGRGVKTGQICAAQPVSNGDLAMTFTTGLWQMPTEYLSQRADIGAAAVFHAYFPCRQAAAAPAPAPKQAPAQLPSSDVADDISAAHGLPPFGFYEFALAAGVNVNDRAALERLATCATQTNWNMNQCGTAKAKRAIAAAFRSPATKDDPEKICRPAQVANDTLNQVACSDSRLAQQLRGLYFDLLKADPRGTDEGLRGHTLGDVRVSCTMIDWDHPQLPLSAAAENCVADYLYEATKSTGALATH